MENGVTLRTHLERIAHKNPEAAKQLEQPPLSRYGAHVFSVYARIAGKRLSSGFGLNPVQEDQIRAFEDRYRARFPIVVVELLHELDGIFRSAHAAQLADKRPAATGRDVDVEP